MACDTLRFTRITSAVFQNLKSNLAGAGIDVPAGNSGSISGKGITAKFSWDGRDILVVQVTDKSFLAPSAMVNSELEKFVAGAGGQKVCQ